MVMEVFRHGARGPLWDLWPELTDEWPKASWGQLTSVGMRQHNLLGASLKTKYKDELGLPDSYDPAVYHMRATGVNRTLQSGASQLVGLFNYTGKQFNDSLNSSYFDSYAIPQYPISTTIRAKIQSLGKAQPLPQRFQPFPIHNYPTVDDLLLRAYDTHTCPAQKIFSQENNNDAHVKQIKADLMVGVVDELATLLNIADKTRINIESVFGMMDDYYCNLYQDISTEMQDKLKNEILIKKTALGKKLENIYNIYLYLEFYYSDKQSQMECSAYLQETFSNFDNAIRGTTPSGKPFNLKLALYSAHDTTLMSFFKCLDITSADCIYKKIKGEAIDSHLNCFEPYPFFASDLIFELHQDTTTHEYFIQILRDSDIVNCGVNSTGHKITMCKWDDFIKQTMNKFVLSNQKEVCKDSTGKTEPILNPYP